MTLKAILVPLNGADTKCDDSALCSALTFASRMNAHVDALHVQRDPRTAAAFVGEGMTTTMIESVIELAEKDIRNRSDQAKALFDKICEKKNINISEIPSADELDKPSAFFVSKPGNQEDLIPEYGRMFDMLVACKKSNDQNTDNEQIINAAILETGRPVLVVESNLPKNFAQKIAVIWNGSVQSSRAITHALPLLKSAKEVSLICAVDDLSEDTSPEIAERYLALHGIKSTTRKIKGGGGRFTAQELMKAANEFNADFLVMGAYTKGRLRRLLFGAVTGEIINNCNLPVLMAH
jgi:nucleotide-binding universal stress UspA family protein